MPPDAHFEEPPPLQSDRLRSWHAQKDHHSAIKKPTIKPWQLGGLLEHLADGATNGYLVSDRWHFYVKCFLDQQQIVTAFPDNQHLIIGCR